VADRQVLCAWCALTCCEPDPGLEARLRGTYGPEGWQAADYQQAGARFLSGRWDALLTDRMGLGKTAEALLALPAGAPVVVVCPSQVKSVWQREFAVWRPEYKVHLLTGRTSWFPPGRGEAVILNYAILPPARGACLGCGHEATEHSAKACRGGCPCEGFRGRLAKPYDAREALGILRGTVLIADEAHKAKSLRAVRTKRLRYLRQGCARGWALTASPIMNHPRELWALYRVFGLSRAGFPGGAREFNALSSFYDDLRRPDPQAAALFREGRSRVELGRSAEDVGLQLPELRFETRSVEITAESRAEIERALSLALAKKKAAAELKAGDLLPADLEARVEALALTSHTDEDVKALLESVLESSKWADVQDELSTIRKALALAKIPAALEFAREAGEAGEALVVFSSHVAPVEALAGLEGWASLRHQAKRAATIEAFQAGELAGVAGTIRGSSEGITLHRARLLLLVDLDWTPEANTQALKRIHRIGQRRGALVTTLVADHLVDRFVVHKIRRKQSMIEALTEATESATLEIKEAHA